MKRRDKNEQGAAAPLSEQEERLLYALFDGELSRDEFGDRCAASVESDLDALRELRREIRSWHAQRIQGADGKPLQVDVWDRIKDQVQEQAGRRAARFDLWAALGNFLRPSAAQEPSFRGSYFGGALVAATVLGFAVYSSLGGGSSEMQGDIHRQLAMEATSPQLVAVARVANSAQSFADESSAGREQLIGELSDETPADVLALISDSDEGDRRRFVPPLPDSLKVRLLSPQMVASNGVVGLRTSSGADIDWIRSSKPFRIVAAQGHSAPPVIWVASKKGR